MLPRLTFALLIFSFSLTSVMAQNDAMSLAKKAVVLMDNGDVNQAIKLLKKARSMDAENYVYSYEIGYAYYLQNDYSKSIKAFESTLNYKNPPDECYQMLGNMLCHNNQKKKALEVYQKGLKNHPKSGKLYVELGSLAMEKGLFGQAAAYWEKGIEVDPFYAPNYFHAVEYYQEEFYPVRAIVYGEIYRNLDRTSPQSEKMSKMLYLAYEKIDKSSNFRSMASAEKADIKAFTSFNQSILSYIRPLFMQSVKESNAFKYDSDYFFDYQEAVDEAGLTEAYQYWMVMKGNEAAFIAWFAKNEAQYNQLSDWFLANKFVLDKSPVFKE